MHKAGGRLLCTPSGTPSAAVGERLQARPRGTACRRLICHAKFKQSHLATRFPSSPGCRRFVQSDLCLGRPARRIGLGQAGDGRLVTATDRNSPQRALFEASQGLIGCHERSAAHSTISHTKSTDTPLHQHSFRGRDDFIKNKQPLRGSFNHAMAESKRGKLL